MIDNIQEVPNELTHEERAAQTGWVPQEDWVAAGKAADDWVSAKEYNRVGEMMERMKSQSSQIKGLEKKVERMSETASQLSEHHRKVKEQARAEALDTLKQMKKDALEMGDYDTVLEVDDKLAEAHREVIEEPSEDLQELPPAIQNWVDTNEWYEADPVLRGAMDALVQDEMARNPSRENDPVGLLNEVSAKLKQEFPSKFGRQERPNTPAVSEPGEGNVRSKAAGKKYTQKDLNPEQKKIGQTFVASGAFENLSQYAEELAKLDELDSQKGL